MSKWIAMFFMLLSTLFANDKCEQRGHVVGSIWGYSDTTPQYKVVDLDSVSYLILYTGDTYTYQCARCWESITEEDKPDTTKVWDIRKTKFIRGIPHNFED
jgi:hypothetical protein